MACDSGAVAPATEKAAALIHWRVERTLLLMEEVSNAGNRSARGAK